MNCVSMQYRLIYALCSSRSSHTFVSGCVATKPAQCTGEMATACRPINYVHDIAGSSPWHASNKDAHHFKVHMPALDADCRNRQPVLNESVALCVRSSCIGKQCCLPLQASRLCQTLLCSLSTLHYCKTCITYPPAVRFCSC